MKSSQSARVRYTISSQIGHLILSIVSPPFHFEFGYLPAPLATETTSVAFTPVAGRITIFLPNRALGYPHALGFNHIITPLPCFINSFISRILSLILASPLFLVAVHQLRRGVLDWGKPFQDKPEFVK